MRPPPPLPRAPEWGCGVGVDSRGGGGVPPTAANPKGGKGPGRSGGSGGRQGRGLTRVRGDERGGARSPGRLGARPRRGRAGEVVCGGSRECGTVGGGQPGLELHGASLGELREERRGGRCRRVAGRALHGQGRPLARGVGRGGPRVRGMATEGVCATWASGGSGRACGGLRRGGRPGRGRGSGEWVSKRPGDNDDDDFDERRREREAEVERIVETKMEHVARSSRAFELRSPLDWLCSSCSSASTPTHDTLRFLPPRPFSFPSLSSLPFPSPSLSPPPPFFPSPRVSLVTPSWP